MNIHKTGYWEGVDAKQFHYHDPVLLERLLLFLKQKDIKSVLDLGCGKADYIKAFAEEGINVKGYDGNPDTPKITNGFCTVMQLHVDITLKLNPDFDLLMTLEVGEHIPKRYEDVFINNIVSLTKNWLVLSWAIPLQAGHGHVNCRENKYVIEKITNKGLIYDPLLAEDLRLNCSFSWFKNTLMVFKRP